MIDSRSGQGPASVGRDLTKSGQGPASVARDLTKVRQLLDRDRHWCIYAIGDLDPRRAGYCEWYTHGGDSLALVYREFDTPILFASGDPGVLAAVPGLNSCFLQIPLQFIEPVEKRFRLDWKRSMHRLALFDRADFRPSDSGGIAVVPLGPADESAIRELYADGRETHEDPDFFMSNQLVDGTFFGVRDAGQLVAAGGTHLFSAPESVGAVGNVYTHRQHRGCGYAKAVTSAIVTELLRRGTRTIALNVKSQNSSALRIYEQLGFRHHSVYWEAFASNLKEN